MINIIYSTISQMIMLIVLLIIAKYIFMELKFDNKKYTRYYFLLGGILMLSAATMEKNFEFGTALVPVLLFEAAIVATRKKRRMQGITLIIPILGIVMSIVLLPVSFSYLFVGSMNEIVFEWQAAMQILDLICLAIIILFLLRGKNWRQNFKNNIEKYELDKWDSVILNLTGTFLFVMAIIVISVDEFNMPLGYSKVLVFISIIVIFLLNVSLGGLALKRYGNYHYRNLAELNEYYLKLQLEYFKMHQETQRETRRIRHDMKNHMTLMNQLAQAGKYQELKDYLFELNDKVLLIDKELHIGNDVADAIVNEKIIKANKFGITIETQGMLPESLVIQPIDLCTIFANAIDNCVEELQKIDIQQKKIEIRIVNHNYMHMISFINVAEQRTNLDRRTWKADKLNHGFGIENIRKAVDKYNGYIEYGIHEKDENIFFRLDVILF